MKQRRSILIVTLAVLSGCSANAAVLSLPPIGDWQGAYQCSQGRTALDLEITAATLTKIDAIFYFHALPANPSVPQGCFMMHGRFDRKNQTILLKPASWLDHPLSFVSVGLRGKVSASGQMIAGTISGPACARFSLTRSFRQPIPPAPAPCRMRQQGPSV